MQPSPSLLHNGNIHDNKAPMARSLPLYLLFLAVCIVPLGVATIKAQNPKAQNPSIRPANETTVPCILPEHLRSRVAANQRCESRVQIPSNIEHLCPKAILNIRQVLLEQLAAQHHGYRFHIDGRWLNAINTFESRDLTKLFERAQLGAGPLFTIDAWPIQSIHSFELPTYAFKLFISARDPRVVEFYLRFDIESNDECNEASVLSMHNNNPLLDLVAVLPALTKDCIPTQ